MLLQKQKSQEFIFVYYRDDNFVSKPIVEQYDCNGTHEVANESQEILYVSSILAEVVHVDAETCYDAGGLHQ